MLPKKHRLLKDRDFKRVFQKGRPFFSGCLGLKIQKSNLEASRFGIVVSTKVAKKAVERNKIKRQIREIFRLRLKNTKPGFDCVVLTQPSVKEKSYLQIEAVIDSLLKRAGLLIK